MGQIITFYSYKGGVGRTMALANIAVLLSKYGHKVLVIDWDIEAPGLDFFFKDYFNDSTLEAVQQREGIVDILCDISAEKDRAVLLSKVKTLPIEMTFPDGKEPVHFITAGRRDQHYYNRLASLDLEKLYTEREGGYFLEDLRNEWNELYDFVLIDSRTGITDIGGVCTIHLPDVLLLLFTSTEQNLRGTLEIAQKTAKARMKLPFDRLSLITVPIPSRFDTTEEFKVAQEWLSHFESVLSGIFANWLPTSISVREFFEIVKIPYVPYFSFGEKLAVLEQGTIDPVGLGFAYETLATLLATKFESIEQLKNDRSKLVQSSYVRSSKRQRVLFLAANPHETSRLRLDSEVREIDTRLRSSRYRENFEIKVAWFSRPSDLQMALLDSKADIVHFSGHGGRSTGIEISFEDSQGQVSPISGKALSNLFDILKDHIQCVVLDSCYSERQAKSIAEHIPFVIGTRPEISAEASVDFATGFYQALVAGRTIEEAFQLGSVQNRLAGNTGQSPVLIKKKQLRPLREPDKLILSLYSKQPIGIRTLGKYVVSTRTRDVLKLDEEDYRIMVKTNMMNSVESRFVAKDIGRNLAHKIFFQFPEIISTYYRMEGEAGELFSLIFETPRHMFYLPLEFIFIDQSDEFLALSRPLYRTVSNVASRRLPLTPHFFNELFIENRPLRILIIASDTEPGIPEADMEAQRLQDFLMAQSADMSVELSFILTDVASYDQVSEALKSYEYDIIFYAGRITDNQESPEKSGLLFWSAPNRQGNIKIMSGSELNLFLAGSTTKLVYLSSSFQMDSSLGLADAVIQAGVPTVIGYRFPVPDINVAEMTIAFFNFLLKEGYPDVALWRARRAVAAKEPTSLLWLSPFLIHQS